jgi:hypothetical protein
MVIEPLMSLWLELSGGRERDDMGKVSFREFTFSSGYVATPVAIGLAATF